MGGLMSFFWSDRGLSPESIERRNKAIFIQRLQLFFSSYPGKMIIMCFCKLISLGLFSIVFVGAAITGCVGSLIESANEEHRLGLILVYALLMYFVGKYVTVICSQIEAKALASSKGVGKSFSPSDHSLMNYYSRVCSEICGFAFKDLFVFVLLEQIYTSSDVNYLFLAWVIAVICVVLVIVVMNIIENKWLFSDHYVMEALIDFESDAFALPLSYSLIVVISLGIGIAPSWGFIYLWNPNKPGSGSAGYHVSFEYYFALVMTFLAAFLRFLGELLYFDFGSPNSRPLPRSTFAVGPLSVSRQSMTPAGGVIHVYALVKALNSLFGVTALGYCVAITWLMAAIDSIWCDLATVHSEVVAWLVFLVVTLYVTYAAPRFIYRMTKRSESLLTQENSVNSSSSSNDQGSKDNCACLCASLTHCSKMMGRVAHHRRYILMTVARLLVGFLWEEMVSDSFSILATANNNDSLFFTLEIIFSIVFFILGMYLTWKFKVIKENQNLVFHDDGRDSDSDLDEDNDSPNPNPDVSINRGNDADRRGVNANGLFSVSPTSPSNTNSSISLVRTSSPTSSGVNANSKANVSHSSSSSVNSTV